MTRIINLGHLKDLALRVQEGMETYFPQFSCSEKLKVSQIAKETKTYAYNNSVVAFVDEKGGMYVIPDIKGTQKLLMENGYKKSYFYVPFSNWDYPVAYEEKWKKLWEMKNSQP